MGSILNFDRPTPGPAPETVISGGLKPAPLAGGPPTARHEPPDASDGVAPFTREAIEHVDRFARMQPLRDFSAAVARAHELDGDAVPAAMMAQADAIAARSSVAPVGHLSPDGLAPFIVALRGELDARVTARSMAGIPALRRPRRGRALGAAVGALVATAAAIFLAVSSQRLALYEDGRGVAASHTGVPGQASETFPLSGRASPSVVADPAPSMASEPIIVPPERVANEGVEPGAPEAASREPVSKDIRVARRRPPAFRAAAVTASPSLEDEALALWHDGELAAAERKYREILAVADDSARAELAFGDLFALVRQLRGGEGQAEIWREYLGRFPAGRFADDARAGLCQRSAADARATCWRDYLAHHPTGVHLRQAASAVGDDSP